MSEAGKNVKVTAEEWVAAHPRASFRATDGEVLNDIPSVTLDISTDARGFPIRFVGRGGTITISLRDHWVDEIHLSSTWCRIVGPGHVGKIILGNTKPDQSASLEMTGGLDVNKVDIAATELVSFSTPQAHVSELIVGPQSVQFGESAYAERILAQPDADIHVTGTVVSEMLSTGPTPSNIKISGGRIRSKTFDGARLTIGSSGAFTLTGSISDTTIALESGGVFEVVGVDALAEDMKFEGQGSSVTVRDGRLEAPQFMPGSELQLNIYNGEASRVDGLVTLAMLGTSKVSGGNRNGLEVHDLDLGGDIQAVENVNFFELKPTHLSIISRESARVSGWWPRRGLRNAAQSIDGGVRSPSSQPYARARYWVLVERLMKDKSPVGRDLALAHDVAEDSRRRAAKWRHIERPLLELSRIGGYAARIAWPIIMWMGVAALAAWAIRLLTSGVCWSGCPVSSGLSLYWEVLVTPVTFVRPLDEGDTLATLVHDDLPAQMVAFAARAFGTWMLVSLALAMRRYLRTT